MGRSRSRGRGGRLGLLTLALLAAACFGGASGAPPARPVPTVPAVPAIPTTSASLLDRAPPATLAPEPSARTTVPAPPDAPSTSIAPASTEPEPPSPAMSDPPATDRPVTDPSAPPATEPVACASVDGWVEIGDGRRYRLIGPATDQQLPAYVVLHGYGGDPVGMGRTTGLVEALRGRAVLALPEGTPAAYGGFGWASGAGVFSTTGVDDVAVLAAVLDDLVASRCADGRRVVLAGESNGGGMVLRATCDGRLQGRVALAVPVNAAVDDGVVEGCDRELDPVALVAVAGRLDVTTPYDGNDLMVGQEAWFRSVAIALNGCSSEPAERRTLNEVAVAVEPRGCRTTTALVATDDGPHTWPGTADGNLGSRPSRYDLNAAMAAVLEALVPA